MPQRPDLQQYLDAGAQFVAMTRAEARKRAEELVSAGQLAQSQVQAFVDDLVEDSRRRTDEMLEAVRKEIQRQVQALGIATKDDLARLEARLSKQPAPGRAGAGVGAARRDVKQPAARAARGQATRGQAAKAAKAAKPAGKKAARRSS